MSYLKTVCNEAGLAVSETPQDADARAVDCKIEYPESDVFVQVKCTAKLLRPGALTVGWRIDPGWVRKWSRLRNPVYFLIVRVNPVDGHWIIHEKTETHHRAYAVWKRIDTDSLGKSIQIPLSSRFTADTLVQWHADLDDGYGHDTPGGTP